ncbi:MAG: 2,3-bisphosphoglycerate-independent phosphoglycerate mutase [Ferruginibacter sp.]
MKATRVILMIMDGWGLGKVHARDAIQHANTPFVTSCYANYPHTTLVTCGEEVGLPAGQMGNSEVGHLNLGAGRIVYQELERINVAIRNGSFAEMSAILQAIDYCNQHQKTLHLIGLVSDGGVHAHINHLKAILSVCQEKQVKRVLIHAFTDGRDTDPKSGLGFIRDLVAHTQKTTGDIATITGRYYAMDRDKRWERVKKAYDGLTAGVGQKSTDLEKSIEAAYAAGITDEFIEPIINANIADPRIHEGDAVFCFNFRTDRCREITEVLTQQAFPDQAMHPLTLHYTTMTEYDQSFRDVHVVFQNDNLTNTLGEVLSHAHKTQLRIAETEKYPHVSFFFSGGRELPFEGENRIMIPSPKVATYDLKPEMSASEVAAAAIREMKEKTPDFICLNFANVDMVGHTGVWEAIVKAVETVDQCAQQVIETALQKQYTVLLTADHGNADVAINEDGSPNTAHSTNPVPLFLIDTTRQGTLKPGKLGDIAPTVLSMLGLPIPAEMTGKVLVEP